MTVLGTRLTLLIGEKAPRPVPEWLAESFESAEVSARDGERSGFELSFRAGRGGPLGLPDYRLMNTNLLRPGSRVIVLVIFNARPHVLIDGLITEQDLPVGWSPGATTLTVRGEDLGYAMDQKEVSAKHPNMDDGRMASKIILRYGHLGIKPEVHGSGRAARTEKDGARTQQASDYAFLQDLAQKNGFVFHIEPGDIPGISLAYWGPQKRTGAPQRALSVNVGSATNVESLSFRYAGSSATKVTGTVRDRETGEDMSIPDAPPSAEAPLAAMPASQTDGAIVREKKLRVSAATASEGRDMAQAETNNSSQRVVEATGELDASRYGDVLKPRGLVGVRGAGYSFDGHWYVQEVTHMIRQGSYRQRFTLSREGLGSTVTTVRV